MVLKRPEVVGRRLMFIAVGTAASVALATVPGSSAGSVRNPDPPPLALAGPAAAGGEAHSSSEDAARSPAYGAYVSYDGPLGVKRMRELSRWLGGYEMRVGHTYLGGETWSTIEGRPGFLDQWAEWRRAKDDRLFVLNVPMLPRNEAGLSDSVVRGLLRRGAAGEFDKHFLALAKRLVELGVPDTILVPGWEMNGTTYTHRCAPDPESWKAYWKRIVTVMRSVPGQRLRFDFTPNRGMDKIPWPECYPGDDYVDIVGMDSYDQPKGQTFDEEISEPYGLQHQVDFARVHGKEISYPEWGLFRNGDNAKYVLRMLAWMDQHKPLYSTISDYCPHGVWQCRRNPYSSALLRLWMASQVRPRRNVPALSLPGATASRPTSTPASSPGAEDRGQAD